MMNKSLKFILLGSILFAAACKKKMTDVKCDDVPYFIYTVGYTADLVDSVNVKWYEKGSSFSQLLESGTYLFDRSKMHQRGDSIYLPMHAADNAVGAGPTNATRDLEIYFPKVRRTYKITNVTSTGPDVVRMEDKPQSHCTDNISGYDLDGKRYEFSGSAPYVYLVR